VAKLEIAGLDRTHPGATRPTLKGVELVVEAGEVLVLVGPSGCGKSTLLRLVAGLDDPDGGSLRLDGRELAGIPPQERDVAMVFQGYALYPHMSVRENIGFPLRMRGVPPAERAKKVDEAAAMLGLGKLLERKPAELSGGERQRVAMGRAIVRRPKIFLFDEPLSNLDAALRTTLRVEIASLLRELDATALYVTHDQIEAMTVGHRIAVMRDGRIEQLGTPREVYESPATRFVAGFLGTPPIDQLEVEVKRGHALVAGRELPLPRGVRATGAAVIAFRPNDVRVSPSDEPASESQLGWVVAVSATEPLGAETIVHFAVEGQAMRAVVPGFFDASLSETVRVSVDPERLHWFDAASGARLGAGTRASSSEERA
jgi:multiple sugar transport system ATP-binding protein